jgi:serine/threonine protein kinase
MSSSSEQVLKTPKSSKSKLRVSKVTGGITTTDGEMELKESPGGNTTTSKNNNKTLTKKKSKRTMSSNDDEDNTTNISEDEPKTPSTHSKEKLALKSPPKTPKTPKTPGNTKRKSTLKFLPEAPLSAPAGRASLRVKSPGKFKSKRRSSGNIGKDKDKDNTSRESWWKLDEGNPLFLQSDSDDDDDDNNNNGNTKLSQEEILRRNEQVQKFRDKYAQELRSGSSKSVIQQGMVAKLLEKANQQKERDRKPMVLPNVRAQPLKLDYLSKFEPPSYKKNVEQKSLIKETLAKKNFITKDFLGKTGTKTDIRTLVKAFESVSVEEGKTIVNQGDQGDHYFVVESGEVEFQVDDVTVRTAGAGSTFGDRNLLYQSPWNETVKAKTGQGQAPIKLLRLNHNAYRGIMQTTEQAKKEATATPPPAAAVKKQQAHQEDENAWLLNSKAVKELNAIKDALRKKKPEDFERIKVLGEGQFGEVWLVAIADLPGVAVPKGKTQHEFALKIQNKLTGGDEQAMIASIRGEVKVMEELSHPFVSSLYRTYEDEDSIDMLLGLIPGGELWDLVHKENEETGEWLSGIPETHAQFYSMVVSDTLSYMHSQGFIFRDLKMENIMLDAKGYPVIVDFGFAKKCLQKTYTFCGTPNYVAPEIIKNAGHDAVVDWWALGVVIYEMISGENPFYYDGLEQMELYQAICDEKPEPLKAGYSMTIVDLVDKLLNKDPSKRLGSGKKKGKEILTHAFFNGLNLKRLRLKKIKAPWIPGEDQNANSKEYEAGLEKERQAVKEEEARLQEESSNTNHAEQEVAIKIAEDEARMLAEQEQKRREAEQQRLRLEKEEEEEEEKRKKEEQRLLQVQRLREQEEERKRLEEEEQRVAEAKWRQKRIKQEEERRQREEDLRLEEEERKQEAEEEAERHRQEEESEQERLRLEAEEEADRQSQEEEAEQERLRLQKEEQAERQRQEEEEEEEKLRRQEEAEEEKQERLRLEGEERQLGLEKEKEELRLQKEREEEERKEILEQQAEEEKAQEKARRKEERHRRKELEKEQAIEDQMEQQQGRQETPQDDFIEEEGELTLDDVFNKPQRLQDVEENWNSAVMSPKKNRRRTSEISPVANGHVKKVVKGGLGPTSPKNLYSPRVQDELNKSIGKGLVAKRLSMAKEKKGSVPSMFSGFSL